MEKLRIWIGWGAIGHAALSFLPTPLPPLPPASWTLLALQIPVIGMLLMMAVPMLLFAAGIGLVKGMNGGRILFAIWAGIAGAGTLVALSYGLSTAMIDLVIIGSALAVVWWGFWKKS